MPDPAPVPSEPTTPDDDGDDLGNYCADLEGEIADLGDKLTTAYAYCSLAREQLGENAWDQIVAGIQALPVEAIRAARSEVGPSPEQIEAAAKAMYDDRMVARWGSDWAYEPWDQFAEKYTQAADNDRRQAQVMLVAASSLRGTEGDENAAT